ncbi:antibiotic biosynthesis monooxygenase [Streptomyces boluensis]|uniref:ABM domain-containing protein n=1 Tax=Streptomyces boluensis TaxID=1775135 RepID=A0A964XLD7_9ACTN|nr:antibiotic biosynthesis monooxygenase [Streptomyces boluensis]NBE53200.1 hypothetical protein [Streptomyces boluensis]
MSAGFVAFHYPHPEYFEEFVGRTRQVGEVLRAVPGCRSVEVWVTPDGDAVVSTARFDAEDDLKAALGAAIDSGAPVEFDERERKPRQIFMLESR